MRGRGGGVRYCLYCVSFGGLWIVLLFVFQSACAEATDSTRLMRVPPSVVGEKEERRERKRKKKEVEKKVRQTPRLVVDNAEVAGDELVLKRRAVRDHNLVALGSDNDAGTRKTNALAEPDVARDSKVVELLDVGDRLEALLEVLHSQYTFHRKAMQSENGKHPQG